MKDIKCDAGHSADEKAREECEGTAFHGLYRMVSAPSLTKTDDFVFPSCYKFIRQCIVPATEGTLLFRLTLSINSYLFMKSPCRAGDSMK